MNGSVSLVAPSTSTTAASRSRCSGASPGGIGGPSERRLVHGMAGGSFGASCGLRSSTSALTMTGGSRPPRFGTRSLVSLRRHWQTSQRTKKARGEPGSQHFGLSSRGPFAGRERGLPFSVAADDVPHFVKPVEVHRVPDLG